MVFLRASPYVHGYVYIYVYVGFPGGACSKELACSCRRRQRRVPSLGWKDPLEEGMAAQSNILAWRIPWTEKPGGLQSMGSHGVAKCWT